MRTIILSSALALAVVAPAANAAAPIAHPTGATDVVLRVTTAGGFVAPQTSLATLPAFTLYGDGTVIVPSARSQEAALTTLGVRRLGAPQVQALLQRARTAGLLRPAASDYGDMGSVGVSDMPTTTVELRAAGRQIELQAYALGVQGHGGRLTRAQTLARLALTRFIAGLPAVSGHATYAPHAFAVYVAPAQATTGTRVRWPLARDLATAGKPVSSGAGYRCTTVSGSAAQTLVQALRHATAQTLWTSGGHAYSLIARPLLPDEADCAALA